MRATHPHRTLNWPEARNALSRPRCSIMVAAWDRVDEDPDIRTCIRRSGRLLLAQAWTSRARTRSRLANRSRTVVTTRRASTVCSRAAGSRSRWIAAVEAPHRGRHRDPSGHRHPRRRREREVRHLRGQGSLYPMGGSARLVRQIPYTIACDLLLTGRHITAAEARPTVDRLRSPTARRWTRRAADRRGDHQQRSACRAGDPQDYPRGPNSMHENDAFGLTPLSTASRCSCPTTPRKARGRSPRSVRPTSR